jgi:hypothetical protein
MSREVHVRFCESPGVQFPRATRLVRLTSFRSVHYIDGDLWHS